MREILLPRAIYYTRKSLKATKNDRIGSFSPVGDLEQTLFLIGLCAFQIAHIAADAGAVGGGKADICFRFHQFGG